MNDLMITTMPIKPYDKINIGLMISPTLCDVLGSILNCKKVLSFNLLHSFDDRQKNLKNYIDNIENFEIKYDEIMKDIEIVDQCLNKIEELYSKGVINIKKDKVLRCDCGRIEISKNSLNSNRNGDLYHWENDKIICNCCAKECKEYLQKGLYLSIKDKLCKNISIIPSFCANETKNLTNKFLYQDILISKNRQNKYYLNIDNQKYNIDIDMIWMMFNQLEESENQILIASNHQLYEMFISNYVNNVLNNKRVHYIATPYLTNNENINFSEKIFSKNSSSYKKLSIIYNLKWKYKTSNWNNGILEILNKLSDDKLNELYDEIIHLPYDTKLSVDCIISNLLKNINLTKNIKVLRR